MRIEDYGLLGWYLFIIVVLVLSLNATKGEEDYSYSEDLQVIPSSYYLDLPCPGQTVGGVQDAIGLGIPKSYDFVHAEAWDCSNMASYLQWRLKSQGYDARICLSKHYQGKYNHAWVEVDLQGTKYYIDATDGILFLRGPTSRVYQDYSHPEQVYETIHDLANEHVLDGFVWWSSSGLDYQARVNGLKGAGHE